MFCRLLIFFFKISCFTNIMRVPNGLDRDQSRRFVGKNVGPDLIQNCFKSYQKKTLAYKESMC